MEVLPVLNVPFHLLLNVHPVYKPLNVKLDIMLLQMDSVLLALITKDFVLVLDQLSF